MRSQEAQIQHSPTTPVPEPSHCLHRWLTKTESSNSFSSSQRADPFPTDADVAESQNYKFLHLPWRDLPLNAALQRVQPQKKRHTSPLLKFSTAPGPCFAMVLGERGIKATLLLSPEAESEAPSPVCTGLCNCPQQQRSSACEELPPILETTPNLGRETKPKHTHTNKFWELAKLSTPPASDPRN